MTFDKEDVVLTEGASGNGGRPTAATAPVRGAGPSGAPVWHISRHADVRTVLSCPFASSDPSKPGFPEPEDLSSRTPFLIELDAPRHADLRRMILPEFTARHVDELLPFLEAEALRFIGQMREGSSPADLVEGFARPMASMAICHLLGAPHEDAQLFLRVTAVLANDDATPEAQASAFQEIGAYMEQLVSERFAHPRDDVISRLASGPLTAGRVSRAELISLAILLLMAGHDTTAKMIELGVSTLLDHPDAVARIIAEPEAALRAADELVRLHSIADDDSFRVAIDDFELGGVQIRKGDGIVPLIRHANHDPDVFPKGDHFDLERETRLHVGFGFGPHTCLGRNLARATLAIAYRTVFRGLSTIRRTTGTRPGLWIEW